MAKKTVTLYSLMVQQLSKQDHYDYGLRNLKAVLNMAGQLKRNDPTMAEEAILMRVIIAFLVYEKFAITPISISRRHWEIWTCQSLSKTTSAFFACFSETSFPAWSCLYQNTVDSFLNFFLFSFLSMSVMWIGTLQSAIEAELVKANLQQHEFLISKIFQFYDSRLTRHCNMLIGDPLGGKSTAWKVAFLYYIIFWGTISNLSIIM